MNKESNKYLAKCITIIASPEAIWPFLSADRIPEWQAYFAKSKIRYLTNITSDQDKFKSGTIALMNATCHHEVAMSIENRMMKYKIYEKNFMGFFVGYVCYCLKPDKESTRMIYKIEFIEPTGLAMKIASNPITIKWLEKRIMKELKYLKMLVELTTKNVA